MPVPGRLSTVKVPAAKMSGPAHYGHSDRIVRNAGAQENPPALPPASPEKTANLTADGILNLASAQSSKGGMSAGRPPSSWYSASRRRLLAAGERVSGPLVAAFQAPLSFLNADLFRRDLAAALDRADPQIRLLVLEASSIVEIDYSAALALREAIEKCRKRGIDFAVARLESVRAQEAFERFGVMQALGPERLFHSVDEATKALIAQPPTMGS